MHQFSGRLNPLRLVYVKMLRCKKELLAMKPSRLSAGLAYARRDRHTFIGTPYFYN